MYLNYCASQLSSNQRNLSHKGLGEHKQTYCTRNSKPDSHQVQKNQQFLQTLQVAVPNTCFVPSHSCQQYPYYYYHHHYRHHFCLYHNYYHYYEPYSHVCGKIVFTDSELSFLCFHTIQLFNSSSRKQTTFCPVMQRLLV